MDKPIGNNISVKPTTVDQTLLGSKFLGKLLGKKVSELTFSREGVADEKHLHVKKNSFWNKFDLWLWNENRDWVAMKIQEDSGKMQDVLVKISEIDEMHLVNTEYVIDENLTSKERGTHLLEELDILFQPQTKKTDETAGKWFSQRGRSSKALLKHKGVTFTKEKLEQLKKLNSGCSEEELKTLGEAIESNKEDWKKNFDTLHKDLRKKGKIPKNAHKDVLYLRKEDTGLPRTLAIYKDGSVLIQLKRKGNLPALGKGVMKSAKLGLDWDRNKIVASASVNISRIAAREKQKVKDVQKEIEKEMALLEKYSGQTGFLEVKHKVSYYTGKGGEKGEIKMGIVMELGDLGTFPIREKIKNNRELAPLADVFEGVATLHRDGLVHGDLKPTNFFQVQGERRIEGKLGDLGNTRKVSEIGKTYFGTKSYVDPAMALNYLGDSTNFTDPVKTDVFSLGCILYEEVTGKSHPFLSINNHLRGEITKKLAKKPVNLDRAKSDAKEAYANARALIQQEIKDEKVRSLLLRVFEPNQKDRISAEELAKELRSISGG